jgi:hypothetical protein
MHGMLSLGILVAAFAGLAGWAGYLLVRLYRACPAPRSARAQSAALVPGRDDDQVTTAQQAG